MISQIEIPQHKEWQELQKIETVYNKLQRHIRDKTPPITEINHKQITDKDTIITYHPRQGKYTVTDAQTGIRFWGNLDNPMYIRWFPWITSNKKLIYLPLATVSKHMHIGLKANVELKTQSNFLLRVIKNTPKVNIPTPQTLSEEFCSCLTPLQTNLPLYRTISGRIFGRNGPDKGIASNVFATTSVNAMLHTIKSEQTLALQKGEPLPETLSTIRIQPAFIRKPLPQEKNNHSQKIDSHEWIVINGKIASISPFIPSNH